MLKHILTVLAFMVVSYIILAAPSKYVVPSIGEWIMVEGMVGLIQFAAFGVLLGLIHKRFG